MNRIKDLAGMKILFADYYEQHFVIIELDGQSGIDARMIYRMTLRRNITDQNSLQKGDHKIFHDRENVLNFHSSDDSCEEWKEQLEDDHGLLVLEYAGTK